MTLSEFYTKWNNAEPLPITLEAIYGLLEQHGYYADIVDDIVEDLRCVMQERQQAAA